MGRVLRKWRALASVGVVSFTSLAAIGSAPASAAIPPLTRAFFEAEPGSYLLPGAPVTLSNITLPPVGADGGLYMTVSGTDTSWNLWIAPPPGENALHVGVYENAQRTSFRDPGHPGIDLFGNGRGCNKVRGRFIVDDISIGGGGVVQTFSARFELRCDQASPVFGAVSINSTADFRGRILSPEPLSFGEVPVGDSRSGALTVTNTGPSALTVVSATIEGADASSFSVVGNTCQSVPAGASCAIEVSYASVAAAGAADARLVLFDDLTPIGGLGRRISLAASAADIAGEFHALTPARVLDTRTGIGGRIGALATGESIDVQITGVSGVPAAGVDAVVFNATAVDPTSTTYLTIWPAGSSRPPNSNVNAAAGQVRPNLVTVAVGAGGRVSLFNERGETDVLFDVVGYYSSASGEVGARFHPLEPSRLLDTRSHDGVPVPLGAGDVRSLRVTGVGAVPPTGVTAVVLNVTVTSPTAAGYLTVYPGDVLPPTASNLNFVPGQTVPNLVVVRVPNNGFVEFFNFSGSVHLIVDVVGYYDVTRDSDAGRFIGLTPARLLDTRAIDAPLDPDTYGVLTVAGGSGVPVTASAAVLNVTVADPTATGFLSVFSDDACDLPLASNLNFVPGEAAPNLVVAELSVGTGCAEGAGLIDIYNSAGTTQVIVDLFGYFT